jgi:hypothetical protein
VFFEKSGLGQGGRLFTLLVCACAAKAAQSNVRATNARLVKLPMGECRIMLAPEIPKSRVGLAPPKASRVLTIA